MGKNYPTRGNKQRTTKTVPNNEETSPSGACPQDDDDGAIDAISTGKPQRGCSTFDATDEHILLYFFRDHPELYDHSYEQYHNRTIKVKLLASVAGQLKTTAREVDLWFKSQRTAVGKLFKHKSGQAAEDLTARQRWQKANFAFLKGHIHPRTYTTELGKLPSSQQSVSSFGDEDSGSEDGQSTPCSSKQHLPSPSPQSPAVQSRPTPKSNHGGRRGTKRGHDVDQAIITYLQDQSSSHELTKKVQAVIDTPTDDKTAWGQWIMARIAKIPDDRWQQFQDESYALMSRFTANTQAQSQHHNTSWQQLQIPPFQYQNPSWQPHHGSGHIPSQQTYGW